MTESLEQVIRHFIGWGYLWGHVWGGLAGAACYHMYRIAPSRWQLWGLRVISYIALCAVGMFVLAVVVGRVIGS